MSRAFIIVLRFSGKTIKMSIASTSNNPAVSAGGGSISLAAIEKLRGRENYSSWAFAAKMLLIREGTWEAVTRAEEDPEDPVTLRALATICLSIDPVNFSLVQEAKTAKQAWKSLQTAFQDNGMTRKIGLLRKLTNIRLSDCSSVEQYVNDLMSTSHKLTEVGFKVDDMWLASLLLMGLPETYEPMIMGLEASGTKITADAVKAKILQDVKINGVTRSSGSVEAFYGRQKPKKKDKSSIKCYRCKGLGHYASECQQKDSKDKKSKPDKRHAAMTTFQVPSRSDMDFYFDSGATTHMCSNQKLLHNVKEVAQIVNVANDSELKAVASGDLDLEADIGDNTCQLSISDILCIPDIAINLLSVSKVCSKGYRVLFTSDACEVRSASGSLVAVGRETGGLYKLCLTSNEVSCAAKAQDDMLLWHRRMGHLNEQSLKTLRKLVSGVAFPDSSVLPCAICLQGKHHRQPFSKTGSRASEVMELIHSDLCGPMEEESLGGSRYFLTFIDDVSRKLFVYFLKSKDEVLDCFEQFKAFAEKQTGKSIKRFRTDNGTEYTNRAMQKVLSASGILHETTVSYNPEQNGLAERMNRTIVEKARCLLFDAGLEKTFWAEATAMAVYLINRSPTKGIQVTPEEKFSGKKPDLSGLRVFGAKCMCYVPKPHRRKWDAKSEHGVFLGIAAQAKGVRVYIPRTKKVIIVRDVVFLSEETFTSEISEVAGESKSTTIEVPLGNNDQVPEEAVNLKTSDEIEGDSDDEQYGSANNSIIDSTPSSIAFPPQKNSQQVIRHSVRERRFPGKYMDYDLTCSVIPQDFSQSQESSCDNGCEPQTFEEAVKSNNKEKWHHAMTNELKALQSNNTWELTDLPAGRTALKCKWVFKVKTNGDGSVERYKARLVIKGFSQVKGLDYSETYAPVVRYASVRYLLAMAVQMELRVYQLDAVTAFLQGELSGEEIFMEQPDGFVDPIAPQKVCRLRKALYGLKQASRVWNIKLDTELKRIGFKRSSYDPCVYFMSDRDRIIVVAIYVDDLLVFSNEPGWVHNVKRELFSKFHMKDLGEAKQILGMRITRQDGAIMLDQQRYIEELLRRFKMDNCNPVSTPAEVNHRLTKGMSPTSEEEKRKMSNVPYRELIGGLQYLVQCTRPDISYAVNAVSSFSNNPGETHWLAAKRILRYLSGTRTYKLVFRKQMEPLFEGFSDADWGNDPDSRRSVTGYLFQLGGGSVSWSCRRQPTVALSTTEAEYMALSSASQEALWWRGFRGELNGRSESVPIRCDNRSTICLAEKEIGYSPRSKHIDVRHHFVREQLEKETIKLIYVESSLQRADSLTKAVPFTKLTEAMEAMGILQISG